MQRFRKKPVVIEAVQYTGHAKSMQQILNWIPAGGATIDNMQLVIITLEGNHIASPGDWIIKGVKGEFYPCKPDIFSMTYEEVPDNE